MQTRINSIIPTTPIKVLLVSRSVVLAFVLVLFCSSSWLADDVSAETDERLDKVVLQLKWKHQFQFAGYYAALEKGFYREAGLDVTILEAVDGQESASQVIDGEADYGIAMSDLVQLRAKGAPVVALACIFQHSPLVILAPKNNGIENIHDLKGKNISLEAHSEQLLSYLDSEGISINQLKIRPHDYDTSKLISGEVDAMSAYSTDEPFLLLNNGVEYSIFTPRAGGIDFYGDTLFTTEMKIEENPEQVAAFLEASLKGWTYALANTEEIVDLILASCSTRHSREHLLYEAQMSKRLIMADVIEIGYMSLGRWQHIVDSFKKVSPIADDFSVKDLLYDKNPESDYRWLYVSLFTALAVLGIAFLTVGQFYKLNRALKREIQEREKTIKQLQEAESEIKTLRGIIPICAYCKGIRDDKGYWNKLEAYLSKHSDAEFSHGICEKCYTKVAAELDDQDEG